MIGRRAVLAVGLVGGLAISGALVWHSTGAVFSAATSNTGNQWQAGKVVIGTGTSSALFALGGTNLKPGDTGTQCITVIYSGNVLATVKMYESAQSGNLAQYVQLTVDRADGAGATDCSDFAALANPATVTTSSDLVWLRTNAGTYADGLSPWTASAATTKTYRFRYALSNSTPNSVQNETASATFVWEAQT
ncbi:hypothetical protein ACQP2E_08710 [Actinoplanes sp. CA-015351]|uniref:hypothetical protein n=1 Tax=Actinoplanes sp. CA-015351 TaxID=3239897 RepID=UPI003D956B3F